MNFCAKTMKTGIQCPAEVYYFFRTPREAGRFIDKKLTEKVPGMWVQQEIFGDFSPPNPRFG